MSSGATIAVFDALSSEPMVSDYPQLDFRNGHAVLDFDDVTSEHTRFSGLLPSTYRGGDVQAILTFAATTATSGDVVWAVAFERIQSGVTDLDADAFAAEVSSQAAVSATNGVTVQATVTLPEAILSAAVAGDPFRLRVKRLADDASDTAAGDAELLRIELREV